MFFVLIFLFLFSFRSSTAAKGISSISKNRWGKKWICFCYATGQSCCYFRTNALKCATCLQGYYDVRALMFELESSAYPHKTLQLVQSECWKRIYLTGVNHILLFLYFAISKICIELCIVMFKVILFNVSVHICMSLCAPPPKHSNNGLFRR